MNKITTKKVNSNKEIKILVLIPTKQNLRPKLLEESIREEEKFLADAQADDKYNITLIRDFSGPGDSITSRRKFYARAKHIAGIRQDMVEKHILKDKYDYVLWIDADLIEYSYSTFSELVKVSKDLKAITAPKIILQGFKDRFYDIAGFVINDRWCSVKYPYFGEENRDKKHVELESVGCFYLVPGEIYYKGGDYCTYLNSKFTEHYSICKWGEKFGYKSICCMNLQVTHATLFKYGERFH